MNARWDDPFASGGKAKLKMKTKHDRFRSGRQDFGDFTCAHCRSYVSAEPLRSGVKNRNHCPYCLWSRHLDLHEAGDRLSACKAPMQPVGLALKRTRKKYAPESSGELMLAHRCSDCGKVSLNRIAADDDVESILAVFDGSLQLGSAALRQIQQTGADLLGEGDKTMVEAQLLGLHRRASFACRAALLWVK